MLLDSIRNKTVFVDKYKTHSEAAIISCFFNPQKSPYRAKAFEIFYDSIKHLNHLIVECIIGDDDAQLPNNGHVLQIYTRDLLWHKESLLNKAIEKLSPNIKYVFWVDADVIFTNLNWLVQGVEQLQSKTIIQPFEYCVHLDKDELKPSFNLQDVIGKDNLPNCRNSKVWRSFSANFVDTLLWQDPAYDIHGHVGFAWGARREIVTSVPLYDRALIGGADHIIAHAAAGQIVHPCIAKSFTDNLQEVEAWSRRFYASTEGKIGYVSGNLYHIWHGDISKREYLPRIQNFTPLSRNITQRDRNGLHQSNDDAANDYMRDYFRRREVSENDGDDGFAASAVAGYVFDSVPLGTVVGGNLGGAVLGEMLRDHSHENFS